jgi:hypothetical protein
MLARLPKYWVMAHGSALRDSTSGCGTAWEPSRLVGLWEREAVPQCGPARRQPHLRHSHFPNPKNVIEPAEDSHYSSALSVRRCRLPVFRMVNRQLMTDNR